MHSFVHIRVCVQPLLLISVWFIARFVVFPMNDRTNVQDAFTLDVEYSNGTTVHFGRRERPDLLFDAHGRPSHLFTGVETQGVHHSWSLVQPVRLP